LFRNATFITKLSTGTRMHEFASRTCCAVRARTRTSMIATLVGSVVTVLVLS